MADSAREASDLEDAVNLARSLIAASRTPAEEYAETMVGLQLAFDAGRISLEDFNIAAAEAHRRMEEANDQARRAGQAWQDQFASAVVAATGRVSLHFKAMADDIIRQIARVIARLLVMRAMMALLAPYSGAGGVVGALYTAFASPFERRQQGGPVHAGRTYLVGERGPELFQPAGAGSIVPNHSLAGGGVARGGPSAGAIAGELLSRLPPVPQTGPPELAATHDWYRCLFSYLVRDGVERGVMFER
jgi:hypothetical protein